MAYGNYGGVAYPPNYYGNGFNGGVPDQGNRFAGQYQQPMNISSPINTPIQQPSNGLIWVQGEEGAKAYLVAPNSTVVLWDSEAPVIYIKSADMSGMPSTRIFDLTERTAQKAISPVVNNTVEYATKDEFSALSEKVHELLEKERERQERYERKKGGAVNNG